LSQNHVYNDWFDFTLVSTGCRRHLRKPARTRSSSVPARPQTLPGWALASPGPPDLDLECYRAEFVAPALAFHHGDSSRQRLSVKGQGVGVVVGTVNARSYRVGL
jgi:hypothetical protein